MSLALVRGIIYAAVIPPWQVSDETGHFEYAWLIAHLGRLPTKTDLSPSFEADLLESLYDWRYGDYVRRPLPERPPARLAELPPSVYAQYTRTILKERLSLAYIWAAVFIRPFRQQDLVVQLYAARFSSILLTLGIIWLAWHIFEEALPRQRQLVAAMTAVVVLLPQHTFINSAVNDGIMAELMVCVALYGWLRLFGRGPGYRETALIVAGTVAAIWSKKTATFSLPLSVGLAGWWWLRHPRRQLPKLRGTTLVLALAGLALAVWLAAGSPAGQWLGRALKTWFTTPAIHWIDELGRPLGKGLMLSFDSFWANFGWYAVPVSRRWYGALLLLCLQAGLGWAIGTGRSDVPVWVARLMAATFFTALAGFVWAALLAVATYQPRGRFLFPVVVPAAFLLVGGWRRLFPTGPQGKLVWLGVLALALFDASSVMYYIIPYFYYR